MTTFQVDDMTCGHCISVITKAIKGVDASANVNIDLATRRVGVGSSADTAKLSAAIEQAGYTPTALPHPSAQLTAAQPTKRSGCCCG